MANFQSTQRTNAAANPPVMNKVRDCGGRIRTAWFDYTAPSSGTQPAIGDTIELCTIPNGARILRGYLWWSAGTASQTGSIGVSGTSAKYLALTAMTSASTVATPFADTIALKQGEVQTADIVLLLTVAGAQVANNQVIQGFVEYAVD